MAAVETLVVVVLNAVAAGLLGWTTWTAWESRERPSALPFAAVAGTLTAWAVFALLGNLSIESSLGPFSGLVGVAELGPAIALPGAWTLYVLGYTGRGTGLTRRRRLMLVGIALPVAVSGVAIAIGPSESAVEGVVAAMAGTEVIYLFSLYVYATYLFVGHGRSHVRVSNRQIAVLVAGVTAPYLSGPIGSGEPNTGGLSVGLVLSGGLLAVAVRRYPVLTGFPRADYVARTRVVEALQEAVVVVDWEDHVLDANATATDFFGTTVPELVGTPIQSVVDGLGGVDLAAGASGRVALQTTTGRRQFQYTVSAVDGVEHSESEPVARAVLLRDVTDRQTREQRLTVLNRVLRHNVRNKLDVILAHAELVDDEDLQRGITDSANELVDLSDKARKAEEVMTESMEASEPVDLTDVARSVAEDYRTTNPDAAISVTCPGELVVSTHRAVVQALLSELVDNALVHNDAATPTVEVTVRDAETAAAELIVADDGPGIPERERRILDDGTETQLDHGSGVGLWFVNWAVMQLGGELQFGSTDSEGSVVTVRFYGTVYSADRTGSATDAA